MAIICAWPLVPVPYAVQFSVLGMALALPAVSRPAVKLPSTRVRFVFVLIRILEGGIKRWQ
ncbi:hypothetical protein HMEPL2_05790 [Vreelandella aquamarina]|uniref:Uncharacterized protein n=1 Tax=Vreelandella aquamarina TaxID=77097 RepID=A0A6F8X812_9GAMM|nr:hypothetical protein HMEPL2_05790 [Halomonas meridiana]